VDDYTDDEVERWYDTAQVCLNGHIVNSMSILHPERNSSYCEVCGEPTMAKCPNCGQIIRGYLHVPGVIYQANDVPPSFCYGCGEPYPWTELKLKAARELVDEYKGLKKKEKEVLKKSIDDIVADTPEAAVGAVRFKKLAVKLGRSTSDALRDLLIDIVSETIRRQIWG